MSGFIAPAEFDTLAENIPDADVRDLVAFLYNRLPERRRQESRMVGIDLKKQHDQTAGREVEVKETA